jgi:ubiquitin-activating enzyme E1
MSIDYELYDRQIRTFGEEANKKIKCGTVGIIGLQKGLGTEVAKNLALCGIQKLYLLDTDKIVSDDLMTGYYYSVNDIGQPRNEILGNKIKQLNPSLQIFTIDNYYDFFCCNVVICINQTKNTIIELNEYCRINNKKFVSLNSTNNSGIVFVDAGNNHLVTNITGETYEPIQILNIDNNYIVKTNGHDFQSGDTIRLHNIQGINCEHLNNEFIIESINRYHFKLVNDFKLLNEFTFINGTASYVDKPVKIVHNNFMSEIYRCNDKLIDYYMDNLVDYSTEIISVNSIMGSVVASETIKLITNKYQPISQWFTWCDEDLDINQAKDKLLESDIFIVGSGAIGCELLKNLAFLNVKKISITDPDIIEKSNLSRQFLFHSDDIGKLKCEVASNVIKQMKPNIDITYYSEKVGDENINFTNKILSNKSLTCVFNALDNIQARRFMDTQCFNYNLPLFESGTMGIKGNTQPVIPFLTETYSNSNDPENEKSYAVCTIKHFPNEIHHTIHWALDQFEFFNRAGMNINKWVQNKDMTFQNTSDDIQMNEDIWLFTTKYNIKSWYECVLFAIDMFKQNYNYQITKLLKEHPEDSLTSEGNLFWSNGKRCPKPITLDTNNSMHLDFIESTTILLCKCINIDYTFTKIDIINIINESNDFIELPDNKELLPINKSSTINYGIPQVFEKDDDTNYHIKWITTASNLRALNYSIEPIDFYTTKGIAGKIIPAIATTTSIVAGLITIEMIKYLSNIKDITKYKSTFINLALNLFVSAEPLSAPIIEIAEQKFNSWYKFIEKDDLTINDFLNRYNELFKTTITMITIGSELIYADFLEDSINKKISELTENNIILSISCDNENVILPDITLQINN